MADHREILKSLVQDIIHDRMEQAEVTVHNYLVNKTQEVSGLGAQQVVPDSTDDTDTK